MKLNFAFPKPVTRFFKLQWKNIQSTTKWIRTTTGALAKVKEEPLSSGDSGNRRRLSAANYINPLFWVMQSFGFIARYFTSRQVVSAIQGMPAVLGLLAPLVCNIWLTPNTPQQIANSRGRMQYFAERREFENADFFARKLCFLSPGDSSTLLARAKLLKSMDRTDDAKTIAAELGNRYGYIPAVEWLSEMDLEAISQSATISPTDDSALLNNLTFILQRQPQHLRANMMLGTLHMMRGRYTNAIQPLLTVTEAAETPPPEAYYSLAVVQSADGQTEKAVINASLAADKFIERDSRSKFNMKDTIQTLRALVLATRESEAANLILQALPDRNERETIELKWVLGEVYSQWCKRLRLKPGRTNKDLAIAMDVIYRAVAVAASNPVVTEELIQLSCNHSIDDETLENQLKVALNSGISPGLVHFIMGTRMLTAESSDAKAALHHFDLASTHNADMPGLLNNMADAMVESGDANLDIALKLVNQAIAKIPNQPHFYDTRGKIFLRQDSPLKAIADLEKALAAPEIRASVHESLAEAYARLENSTQAEVHKTLAESIKLRQQE